MTTEHFPERCNQRATIECALQNDLRLFAGVRAIVLHSAEQAGLGDQTREELAATTIEVCREAFALAEKSKPGDAGIKLIVGGAPDRIEIAIDYPGDAPRGSAVGNACAANGAAKPLGGVDHVRCENRDGRSRVTLIKHCHALKSKSLD